jgi:hypothetical protein
MHQAIAIIDEATRDICLVALMAVAGRDREEFARMAAAWEDRWRCHGITARTGARCERDRAWPYDVCASHLRGGERKRYHAFRADIRNREAARRRKPLVLQP